MALIVLLNNYFTKRSTNFFKSGMFLDFLLKKFILKFVKIFIFIYFFFLEKNFIDFNLRNLYFKIRTDFLYNFSSKKTLNVFIIILFLSLIIVC